MNIAGHGGSLAKRNLLESPGVESQLGIDNSQLSDSNDVGLVDFFGGIEVEEVEVEGSLDELLLQKIHIVLLCFR